MSMSFNNKFTKGYTVNRILLVPRNEKNNKWEIKVEIRSSQSETEQ